MRKRLAFVAGLSFVMCWAMKADPVARFEALQNFCAGNGLKTEADFYGRCLKALGK